MSCDDLQLWDIAPVPIWRISAISARGELSPPLHVLPTDHVYFRYDSAIGPLELRAPGALHLDHIRASAYLTGWRAGKMDYGLDFLACKTNTDDKLVVLAFRGVARLSAELEEAIEEGGSCATFDRGNERVEECEYEVDVAVEAGTLIGSLTGAASPCLDVFVEDPRYPNGLDPARYPEPVRTSACALDYFAPNVRAAMVDLLGGYADGVWTQPAAEPKCGTQDLDVYGTAKGNWFRPGYGLYDEQQHIALAHLNVAPGTAAFSIGALDGVASGLYVFVPGANVALVNRPFDAVVSDGTVHCYEAYQSDGATARFVLQLLADDTLKIEAQGKGPCGSSWGFGSQAEIFRR